MKPLKGKEAAWDSGYPCRRCDINFMVYPSVITEKRTLYGYFCTSCNNQGQWPPFNVWSKAHRG